MATIAPLRRGHITMGDMLGALLGALTVLGVMTYLRIRDFERIKREIRSPLPECAQECADCAGKQRTAQLEQPAPPPAAADGLEVRETCGRDAIDDHGTPVALASDHAALDKPLGEIYVVVGQRLYRLAPVADEELKELSAPAVGIFNGIGSHVDE